MNNQKLIKEETEKIEVFILGIIENIWVGRGLLSVIMVVSLALFIWASSLGEHMFIISFLFIGALINFLLLFSGNKRLRDIAIFFAVMISVCFLFIVLCSSIFLLIINKTA